MSWNGICPCHTPVRWAVWSLLGKIPVSYKVRDRILTILTAYGGNL